jgi:DNA-binding response OmpR family regulator/tRNA A-37 threonylcarbamoyl transferase component Bud32
MAGERVLIIEDDTTLLRGLKDNFESRGYRVDTASDGEAGLEASLRTDPDLIILDIMLPKMNGYEICRAVREQTLETPIIMLTAKGQEDDIVRGLDVGADDYVTKPFSIKELLARANAFLRRSAAGAHELLSFGDCRLDVASHKLFRSGVEVTLTPKEFALLEYLVKNASRALTRDQILQKVWGGGVLVTTRSVDRCVATLRAKIEPDPRYPIYLQTIRDIGYRFEIPPTSGSSSDDGTERPPTLIPGTCLGRYEIQGLLGRGGMSEVYRARDSQLDRPVAIKVLPRRLAREPELQQRFKRETKAIAALSHANILGIFDVGRDRGLTYAVTELLEGESLQARLERASVEWGEAIAIAVAVADGLAAAHAKRIIHRDIKPGNIFLPSNDGVKILDFGLARLDDGAGSSSGSVLGEATTASFATAQGKVMGTVAYMSPEQVRGITADARSDIFSLCGQRWRRRWPPS